MSKRSAVAGAVAAALVSVVAVAWAQGANKTFTDPQNRFSFQYPASLPVDTVARPNQPLNVLVGAADYECQMFVIDRPDSAAASPEGLVRAYGQAALAADVWKRTTDGFALYNRQSTVQATSVDTSRFWPVQRADLRTGDGTAVIAAMQGRPGVEVWQYCTSFDGRDHAGVFNQIIGSFAGANDAALQAQAEANLAAKASAQKAADDAAAAAAAKAAEKGKKRR